MVCAIGYLAIRVAHLLRRDLRGDDRENLPRQSVPKAGYFALVVHPADTGLSRLVVLGGGIFILVVVLSRLRRQAGMGSFFHRHSGIRCYLHTFFIRCGARIQTLYRGT